MVGRQCVGRLVEHLVVERRGVDLHVAADQVVHPHRLVGRHLEADDPLVAALDARPHLVGRQGERRGEPFAYRGVVGEGLAAFLVLRAQGRSARRPCRRRSRPSPRRRVAGRISGRFRAVRSGGRGRGDRLARRPRRYGCRTIRATPDDVRLRRPGRSAASRYPRCGGSSCRRGGVRTDSCRVPCGHRRYGAGPWGWGETHPYRSCHFRVYNLNPYTLFFPVAGLPAACFRRGSADPNRSAAFLPGSARADAISVRIRCRSSASFAARRRA